MSDFFTKVVLTAVITIAAIIGGGLRIGVKNESSAVQMPQPIPQVFVHKSLTESAGGEAERRGFEPRIRCDPYDALAKRCLQPLGHLSRRSGIYRMMRGFARPG